MKKKSEKRFLDSFIPTKKQWKGWPITNKLTAIGAYLGLLGIIISIIFFVIPFYLDTGSPKRVIHSKEELVSLLKTRAGMARSHLQEIDRKMETNYAERFYELHLKHIHALEADNLIVAHEELRKIQALSEEAKKAYESYAYSKSDNGKDGGEVKFGVAYGPPPYIHAHYYIGDTTDGLKHLGLGN